MINFTFNLSSKELKVKLRPANTFTEIDAISNLFSIERYEGEKYKNVSPFLQRVSIAGEDSSVLLKAFEAMRSDFFCLFMSSKSDVNKFLIELNGHYDLIVEEHKYDEVELEWTKEKVVYAAGNRKEFPFLSSLLVKVREDFPNLEIRTLGLLDEENLSVSGLSLVPFKNYEDIVYNFDKEENILESMSPTDLVYSSDFEEHSSTNFTSTNQFYIDRTSMRLTLSPEIVDEFSLRTKRIEGTQIVFGFKDDTVYSVHSQEMFKRFIHNNTFDVPEFLEYEYIINNDITFLNETPAFLDVFYEAEQVGSIW